MKKFTSAYTAILLLVGTYSAHRKLIENKCSGTKNGVLEGIEDCDFDGPG